jgi:hypothetical protein
VRACAELGIIADAACCLGAGAGAGLRGASAARRTQAQVRMHTLGGRGAPSVCIASQR